MFYWFIQRYKEKTRLPFFDFLIVIEFYIFFRLSPPNFIPVTGTHIPLVGPFHHIVSAICIIITLFKKNFASFRVVVIVMVIDRDVFLVLPYLGVMNTRIFHTFSFLWYKYTKKKREYQIFLTLFNHLCLPTSHWAGLHRVPQDSGICHDT